MPETNDIERLKISVIMPAYNAAATIRQSIDSVRRQTHQNWELIVVNDGSKDNTLEVARNASGGDARVIILDLPKNGGLPNARNQGCMAATSQLIAFLDSDDLWHKDKLSVQAALHSASPDIDISHTAFELFNDQGTIPRRFRSLIDTRSSKEGYLYPSICYKNPIGILTVVVKKEVLTRAGMFDASLWTFEDQDLWIRIAKQGSKFGYIPKVLASYRLSQSGITSRMGRYKKTYKSFVGKVLADQDLNSNLMWRYYYRYFGTAYFKKGEFRLSRLYFWKSILLRPLDVVALTTWAYLAAAVLKGFGSKRRKSSSLVLSTSL